MQHFSLDFVSRQVKWGLISSTKNVRLSILEKIEICRKSQSWLEAENSAQSPFQKK